MEPQKISYSSGSITVFLALILLIVMALLGTLVEVTRERVCRVHSRRTLQSATESLLAEYNRPLYEEYHLFFLEDTGKPFIQSIAEYASDSLQVTEGITPKTDLYDGVLNQVSIESKKYIGDNGMEALREQIADYMKRELASDAFDAFCQKIKPVEKAEQTAEEIETTVQEEKQAAKLSSQMLELMELIDGVHCSNGSVQGVSYFMKMLCPEKKRAEALGITDAGIWDVVKEKVTETEHMAQQIINYPTKRFGYANTLRQMEKKVQRALQILPEIVAAQDEQIISPVAEQILSSNLQIIQEAEEMLKEEPNAAFKERFLTLWKGYDTTGITFDYTGVNEEGGEENPLECFQKSVAGGLLSLVYENPDKISEKKVSNPDHYNQLYQSQEESAPDYGGEIQEFANKEELGVCSAVKDIAGIATTDFLVYEYMKRYFSTVRNPLGEGKKRLNYEWEYLVCGGESDEGNLEQIAGRLVLMRTVMNMAVLLTSSARRETAYAAALAVVGFTGMEPLVRFTQTLFLLLWGVVESLVDVAGILQGKAVPLVKTEKNWSVEFLDLYKVNHNYIMKKVEKLPPASKNSFAYEEYLILFMQGNGSSVTCSRMMDLMEWKIRDNYVKGFNLGICVEALCVSGVFSFSTKFFRLPHIRDMLERNLQQFSVQTTVNVKY